MSHIKSARPSATVAIFLLLLCMFAWPAQTAAQVNNPDQLFALGVVIDSDGLISVREPTSDVKVLAARKEALLKAQRLAKASGRKDALTYISLPRLFAAAKEAIDQGKEIPKQVRYLGGMTKLKYIFVYPGEKDLVIAGEVEPYSEVHPSRPIGLHSGRPVLQLDDLVVALRTVGPGSRDGSIGCSIDPPKGAMEKVAAILEDKDSRKLSRDEKSQKLTSGVGPQSVRIIGVQDDTRVAYVCVEADYLLKRLAMGVDQSPVPMVKHTNQHEKMQFNRLWLTPSYEPLLVTDDGLSFEIRGQSLQLSASGDQFSDAPASPGTAGYAKLFTRYFPQLAQSIPAFADLWNITDLALLASLMGQDDLHKKANWDLKWVLARDGYPVAKVPVVKEADTMAHYRTGAYIIGGVQLEMVPALTPKSRQRDEAGKLKELATRPENGQWEVIK